MLVYDVVVIGGGPGGYFAAIRASQLGGKVLLIEKADLGGVCLNRGCIPTKTLLNSAQKLDEIKRCLEYGIAADNVRVDFEKVFARKEAVISKLRAGMGQVIKSQGVELVYGQAVLAGKNQVTISRETESETVETRSIIIATGSSPMEIPIPGADLPGVINSNDLLALTNVPKSMAVIGAGAVGIEFAAIYQTFGCEVTVVEMLPAVLPSIDMDLVKRMTLVLKKTGMKLLTKTKVLSIDQDTEGLVVNIEGSKGANKIHVEKVLVAVGRRPLVSNIGLENAGVDFNSQGIKVNERMETNIPNIYAIGDVTGEYMWAHAASFEGMVAAENAMGRHSVMDYRAVPGCIFTTPEIASVGLTEGQAIEQGMDILISRSNFAGNGKAVSMGETDGLVKTIADAKNHKILGMHIMGPHASDLIMEGTIAMQNDITSDSLTKVIHPHPTLSETVLESFVGIGGENINQVKMKK